MNENDIKNVLTNEYNRYIKMHANKYIKKNNIRAFTKEIEDKYEEEEHLFKNKIIDILIVQGKKTRGDTVKTNKISFSSFIHSSDYCLTNFDLWILFNYFKIPAIFISTACFFEKQYSDTHFVAYSDGPAGAAADSDDDSDYSDAVATTDEKFVFIVSPGSQKKGDIPQYKLISNSNALEIRDNIKIGINDLINETCKNNLKDSLRSKMDIYEFINGFVPLPKTEYLEKKKKCAQAQAQAQQAQQVAKNNDSSDTVSDATVSPPLSPAACKGKQSKNKTQKQQCDKLKNNNNNNKNNNKTKKRS